MDRSIAVPPFCLMLAVVKILLGSGESTQVATSALRFHHHQANDKADLR
jgi:hypothetical protein